ncbi:MAG TPA: hypothetical protein VN540_04785 [Clostridia bacterium]|nr:hypothetical protein [Clostridia bacterium]
MAVKIFRIDEFTGIDQSRDENALPFSMSPDACNMETANGALAVAKGYARHIPDPIPGEGDVHALHVFAKSGSDLFVVAANDAIYAWDGAAWQEVYAYEGGLSHHRFDFEQARIDAVDYLIIGCGERQLVKFDGTTASLFGSLAGVSDIHALYLAMYRGRLFSAGDPNNPNRLYWSQLPGGGRSIENWGPVEASPNVEGGHAEVGSIASDPIVGLAALSNQLIIFKKHSIYRLLGDRPGNFTIEEVDSRAERTANTAVVKCGDMLYFMTAGGMCCFNGVTAEPMRDARKIRLLLEAGNVSASMGALCRDKLYFSMTDAAGGALIEYDLVRAAYMLRRGFSVRGLCARAGTLYLVDGTRRVCRFNEGEDYDGAPISAWWRTPETDLHEKSAVKGMRALYLRGSADARESAALVDVTTGALTETHRLLLPERACDVLEVPLKNEGRTFRLQISNEAGGRFAITSGAELEFELKRRTI